MKPQQLFYGINTIFPHPVLHSTHEKEIIWVTTACGPQLRNQWRGKSSRSPWTPAAYSNLGTSSSSSSSSAQHWALRHLLDFFSFYQAGLIVGRGSEGRVVLDQVEDGWIRVASLVKEPDHSRNNQNQDHTDDDQSWEKRTVLWRRGHTKTRTFNSGHNGSRQIKKADWGTNNITHFGHYVSWLEKNEENSCTGILVKNITKIRSYLLGGLIQTASEKQIRKIEGQITNFYGHWYLKIWSKRLLSDSLCIQKSH